MTEKYIKVSECEKYFYEHLDDAHIAGAMNAIDEIPAADVQPVIHGRWITSEIAIDSGYTSCSCCRSEYYIGDLQALEGDNGFVMYCPNCGARMDGDNSDENT